MLAYFENRTELFEFEQLKITKAQIFAKNGSQKFVDRKPEKVPNIADSDQF